MANLQPLSALLATDQMLSKRWSDFGSLHDRIASDLATLPSNFSFVVKGTESGRFVGAVSIADLKTKFGAIVWRLVGANFDNGGVGAVRSIWKNGLFKKKWIGAEQDTNAEHFRTYAQHPDDAGLYYLALHEAAHVTELGLTTGNQSWNMFLQTGGAASEYSNTDLWRFNEAVANSVVQSICVKFGWPMLANPGAGFVK